MAKTLYWTIGILIGVIGIVIFLNRSKSTDTPTTPVPTTPVPTQIKTIVPTEPTTPVETTPSPTTPSSTTPSPTTPSPTTPTPTTQSPATPTPTTPSPTTPSPAKIKIMDYITQLDNATTVLTKASSKINNAYGLKNGFYIAGQAIPPSTGITKIGPDVIKSTTTDCTLNVPTGTTMFIYNPITMTCSYYSGNINLSSLQIEPVGVNSRNRTIGSTLL